MSERESSRTQRRRLAFLLLSAIFIFATMYVLYSFIGTLQQLDAVESERDRWQRPLDVLQALDLKAGNTVVDLGSGAGYFALKLSTTVGRRGQVLAVDLRKVSLFFLWTRALLRGGHNVHVMVAGQENPHLPAGTVDAILVCNAYHEFSNPELILNHIHRSLRPGGRVVVVDRASRSTESEHTHEVPLATVESSLRREGFEIVSRNEHFIDQPGDELWWLVIGRKP